MVEEDPYSIHDRPLYSPRVHYKGRLMTLPHVRIGDDPVTSNGEQILAPQYRRYAFAALSTFHLLMAVGLFTFGLIRSSTSFKVGQLTLPSCSCLCAMTSLHAEH